MNNTWDSLSRLDYELKSRTTALKVFESIFYAFLFFSTVAGNLLTIYVVWKAKSLWTIPNVFVVSLALSDLGMGILSMHLLLTVLITSQWTFGDSVCQYQGFVAVFMAATSTQTLAWMAINRFYSVVKPQKCRIYFTRRNTMIITATIWGLSFFAPTPYLASGKRFLFNPGKLFCYVEVDSAWFTVFLVTFFVATPSSIIFFCYLRVFQAVQQHNNKVLHSRENTLNVQEIKIARTLFVIVVVFMICWTPVFIMDFIDTIRGDYSLPRGAYASYTFLASISSSINPIIYGIMNPKFRKEYLRVLLCKPVIRDVRVEATAESATQRTKELV